MRQLPERPNLGHLKKQAKDLLQLYGDRDAAAIARLRESLPAAAGKSDGEILSLALRLHDAQSCVAREYGFASWTDLKCYVEAQAGARESAPERLMRWLRLVYSGDITGNLYGARPAIAARMLEEAPGLLHSDPQVAAAIGDEEALRRLLAADSSFIDRPSGPLELPPLLAVTHSSLVRLPAFRDGLHRCARLLLAAGADPNQSVGSRWPPASIIRPAHEHRLSALYGAAGQNHDPELTRVLLAAGADPNDGESLYHSLESPACTRLLLEAGARIQGSNALYRALDLEDVRPLEMLLAAGADPNEPPTGLASQNYRSPLLRAISRRRPAHAAALLRAGADARATTTHGVSAYRLALQFGLAEVAELLREMDVAGALSVREQFVAACARAADADARQILSHHPDLLATLSPSELRLLPDLAAEGAGEAVKMMVLLGWPIETQGGDWQASALNHAVFRGDAELARFLLEHGARWTEKHGFGDDVCGTLAWASCNEPVEGGDWVGCAEALIVRGMPGGQPDPRAPERTIVDGKSRLFSDEVSDCLLTAGRAR